MPIGNGKLFLPVRAEIRKKIKMEVGDFAHVILYSDQSSLTIPVEIIECFKNEPQKLYDIFIGHTDVEQKTYLDWICRTKTEETKADRISKMMERLQNKLKFYDKDLK